MVRIKLGNWITAQFYSYGIIHDRCVRKPSSNTANRYKQSICGEKQSIATCCNEQQKAERNRSHGVQTVMVWLWATLSHETNYSQHTINGFLLSATATASNRVSCWNAFQNIRSQRHILHDIATDHKHFLQLTSKLIVTATQHHHFVRYRTTEKHRRKYMRSPCNAWAFLRRGKEWVVSRYGRLVIRLGFKACLSANLTLIST
jgi:hypothetical protein